jgi:SNF2 family DNA or RNA helicase
MQTLLPFQEAAVPHLARRNFLLADDCGLGKTLMAVEAAKRHARGPILVICPKPVKEWWAQVIREQGAGRVCIAGTSGRGCPYEQLNVMQVQVNPVIPRANQGREPYLLWVVAHTEAVRLQPEMRLVEWDWIIADEAHRFKNRKAKQTRALWKLKSNRRIAMTATPYGRNPADMWALLHWLYPSGTPEVQGKMTHRLFTSYWKFFNEFVEAYKPPGEMYHIVQGPKRLNDLATLIEPFYRRMTKDEANLGLPPITYSDVPVLINGKQEALYKRLVKDSYADLAGHEVILENALVKILRLHQCLLDPNLLVGDDRMFVLGQAPAKITWLMEWLNDHPDEPVVIISRYRRFVEEWLRELAPQSCIVGGMKDKAVTWALKEFRKPRAEGGGILVGSLAAAAEGLNLQHASTMIVTDGTWSPALAYQLSNRIHRIGQDRPCQVMHLVGVLTNGRKRRTVDHLVRRALTKRMSEQQMVDGFVKELQEVAT